MRKLKLMTLLLSILLVFGLFFTGCQKKAEPAAAAPAAAPAAEAVVKVNTVEAAANAYFAEFPGSRALPFAKITPKIDAGENMMFLDIRSAEDYAKGHIKGAVNAPWGPAIAASLDWLPDDVTVYVNCYTGQTAGQAISVLNTAGIKAESIQYGWNLGISKTEGFESYIDTTPVAAPESSGVKYDADVRTAVEAYFNVIPDKGSNIWPASKVKEAIDAEEDIFILSVRQAADYEKGHVPGAVNIPYGKGMQESFSQLPKDKTVVVYCYSGQTAGQTVGILRLLGYDAVSLKSGMGTPVTAPNGWMNEGFPVVQ
jgi:rhodanese-related sulfurtransferase